MEEGCFSSVRSGRGLQSKAHSQKISSGLTYPVYIITSSFNSPLLKQLQKMLEKEMITLSFQNELDRLNKITNTHQTRFFVVLNDFNETPTLCGEFLQISCEVAEFPKQSLEDIFKHYRQFVEKEKIALTQNSAITELIFLSNMNLKKQIISSTDTQSSAKIQMRSISKIIHNYKSCFPKKLFVYSNSNDDEFFLECLKVIEKYQILNGQFITRIEQYLKFLPTKEDIRFFTIMSEYSAINLRKYFKKCDDLVVCTRTPEHCLPLLKGKVTQIICDTKTLDNLITKNFNFKLKFPTAQKSPSLDGGSGEIPPDLKHNSLHLKIQNVNLQPQSSILPSSIKSSDHLKISQQYSLLNINRKQLNIQSSIFGLTISPSDIKCMSEPERDFKIKSNYSLISPMKVTNEEVIFSPLKIVQLDHIDVAACSHIEGGSSCQGSNVFNQMQNKIDYIENSLEKTYNRNEKINTSFTSSEAENFLQNHSQDKSQTSRSSQRSSRNSRIIERYKEFKKEKKRI